mmetsp:Transcript_77891/g.246084  ORF Transcript_77891/g.246084 Transcript_77891/m.246084 type:complete len:295 (-) Transcript_77891:719-1603(-)
MDFRDWPSESSLVLATTSGSVRGKPEFCISCVIRPQRPPIPPGNFCKPLAKSPSSSVVHGAPAAAAAAEPLASLAFCSSSRLASWRCRSCCSFSSTLDLCHLLTSSLMRASAAGAPFAASSRPQRASSSPASMARQNSWTSSISALPSLHLLWTHFFSLCRRALLACFSCLRCSRSRRSFSSRAARSSSSRLLRSSSCWRLASSSSCLARARLSFSSRFLASRSSFSARIRGSSRSAVSTSLKTRFRSASWYRFRTFWFCRSIHRRSSRNSASSRLYSSCMEKSRQVSKLYQKS